jgi:hypothetical protein
MSLRDTFKLWIICTFITLMKTNSHKMSAVTWIILALDIAVRWCTLMDLFETISLYTKNTQIIGQWVETFMLFATGYKALLPLKNKSDSVSGEVLSQPGGGGGGKPS